MVKTGSYIAAWANSIQAQKKTFFQVTAHGRKGRPDTMDRNPRARKAYMATGLKQLPSVT